MTDCRLTVVCGMVATLLLTGCGRDAPSPAHSEQAQAAPPLRVVHASHARPLFPTERFPTTIAAHSESVWPAPELREFISAASAPPSVYSDIVGAPEFEIGASDTDFESYEQPRYSAEQPSYEPAGDLSAPDDVAIGPTLVHAAEQKADDESNRASVSTPKAPEVIRSPQMDIVARRAEQHVREGWRLAERGATLSARAEFIQALRTVAQAWDVQTSGRSHSEALAAGLRALTEAEDFIPRGAQLEANLDIACIARGHQTPVLHSSPQCPAVLAVQRYYDYACEQLTVAAHGERAASLALYGLGRVHASIASSSAPIIAAAEGKSAVFHQAAVLVDPNNYMSANELAVIAARQGRYETARDLLLQCVRVAPQPTAWRNLARVHRYLGELQLAEQAMMEANAAVAKAAGSGPAPGVVQSDAQPSVRWLTPEQFASSSRPSTDLREPKSTSASKEPPAEKKQGLMSWLPWSINR